MAPYGHLSLLLWSPPKVCFRQMRWPDGPLGCMCETPNSPGTSICYNMLKHDISFYMIVKHHLRPRLRAHPSSCQCTVANVMVTLVFFIAKQLVCVCLRVQQRGFLKDVSQILPVGSLASYPSRSVEGAGLGGGSSRNTPHELRVHIAKLLGGR